MNHVRAGLLDQQFAANLQGNFGEGWRIAQILEKEEPENNRAAYNRGWHYLQMGNLQEGMRCLDRGRSEKVFGSEPLPTPIPQWQGEDLQGKTILLRGEGGFGDEMINVRFAKTLSERGAKVIVACSDGLISLFRRAPGVSSAVSLSVAQYMHFDYWVPAMSALLPLGITYETLPHEPYLTPDPTYVSRWKERLAGPGLKIGIRWGGNPRYEHEQFRAFSPEPLFSLANIPGIKLYSLQRDNDLRDLPANITDLQLELNSWEDTAAAIANMDLVITSCTSVAHLAAGMGKETWVIVPMLSYYVWGLPGNKSPWYPSVTLFRQKAFGVWDETLADVAEAFKTWAGTHVRNEHAQPLSDAPLIPNLQTFSPPALPTPAVFTPVQKPPRISGISFAPKPPVRASASTSTARKSTAHFVAGLPRCGSTALMSLMAQNPRIFSAPLSGLCGILAGIRANWDKGDSHIEYPNPEGKRRVLLALIEQYHGTDRPIILDKSRQWVSFVDILEELLGRAVKIIVPVRPMPEILASFEDIRRRNPFDFTNADESIGAGSTLETRAAYYAGAGGPLGLAYNGMKDAVTAGYLDRMLFVDYNKLTSAPKMQLKRIYEFLEEPYFEHNLGHVEQVAKGDWRVHKLPGLHDIRSVFAKDAKSAREILGEEIYGKYNSPEPWTLWT